MPEEYIYSGPSYSIVKASVKIGVTKPEDRRWEYLGVVKDLGPAISVSPMCGRMGLKHKVVLRELQGLYIGQCPHCSFVYWTKKL